MNTFLDPIFEQKKSMKIAIVQDGPAYLDLRATLDKTIQCIQEASREGADLIVFGECWMSGYPFWLDICRDVSLWDHPPIKEVWAKTFEESLVLHDETFIALQSAIKEFAIHVVLGANEAVVRGPGNGTIYNSIFTFSSAGELINHHRKLMPTFTEKLVHGLGDGHGLNAVDTPFGRLGSLICWEHWMPLTRQAMHDEGEDIHIALWPFVKDLHHVASRHYAHEGRCIVVAVGQIMTREELPPELEISNQIDLPQSGLIMRGGSAIYGPDGQVILNPIYDQRKMVFHELDLSANRMENMNLSVSGHYQRNDVFDFNVKKNRR